MVTVLAAVFGLFLAYANGANDNFKGVATLFGSATADYRRALLWATVTTFAGSLAAVTLAGSLVIAFTGKGLVPDALVGAPAFTLGVAAAAGITVMLATRFGLPISTTHALTGALVGAGFAAVMTDINLGQLWIGFFRPLMISPVLAIAAAALLYPLLHRTRKAIGVERETCLCVGETVVATVPGAATPGQGMALAAERELSIDIDTVTACEVRYHGKVMGVSAGKTLDAAHYLSAGAVSFARGVNDTPKIAALFLTFGTVGVAPALAAVGAFIALGGLFSARRVAETMSLKVTDLNAGQGLTANMTTTSIVLAASWFGLPVSTTHVSCGALFGIGAVTGHAKWKTIATIVAAWVT
ncbi:MAG: inorganic phosphate transporter, partial [Rhodospirillaceae bacterium]|nr:inorganic phosphate transporter [Rhodospirillaceae bacterium]